MKCLCCDNRKDFILLGKTGVYSIYRCPDCSFEFVDPPKAGDQGYYEDSYGSLGGGYGGGEEKWEYRRFLEDLSERKPKGRLLEVGCGPGWLLKSAQEKGMEVFGIDFNRFAIEHAKQIGVANAKVADVSGLAKEFPGIRFDAVVVSHVLEHVENPEEFLSDIGKTMAKDGILGIAVPNSSRSSLKFNIWGNREGWDYPPHHLTRWSKNNLASFLERNGFRVVLSQEERVAEAGEIFNFAKGIIYLATNIVSSANMSGGGNSDSDRRVLGMKTSSSPKAALSLLRKWIVLIFAVILFLPVFLICKLTYIKGTNLYFLAEKIGD